MWVEWPWSSSCQTIKSKKHIPSNFWTYSMNHASLHWMTWLILTFSHICLPMVFAYTAASVGLSHGYMLNAQFSWPAGWSYLCSSFDISCKNSPTHSTSHCCFLKLRYMAILFGSTSNPKIRMITPKSVFSPHEEVRFHPIVQELTLGQSAFPLCRSNTSWHPPLRWLRQCCLHSTWVPRAPTWILKSTWQVR